MPQFMRSRLATTARVGGGEPPKRPEAPKKSLVCAARHLYCSAGDLGVEASSDPVNRERFGKIKARLRPLLVGEATLEEYLSASPRILTAAGQSWTLVEAVAAVLTERRAAELENEIDPSVVELAARYLKGVHWAYPEDAGSPAEDASSPEPRGAGSWRDVSRS